MDFKLRLIFHIPTLFPLPVLYSGRNGLPGDSFVAACINYLA